MSPRIWSIAGRVSVPAIFAPRTRRLEIAQLIHFLAVDQHASFTKAAKVVALSQPALSRSIARLEDELGQPLFERQSRQVVLTDAGRVLRGYATQVVELVDRAKAEITDDGQTGRVRLGAIPTIAPYLVPRVISAFRTVASLADIVVSEDVTENLTRACAAGDIDVALMALPVEAPYLEVEPLFEDELLLVLPAAHSLHAAPDVCLDDLRGHPFVLLNEAHCLTDNVVTACRSRAVEPVSVERTSQLAMVLELVAMGHGVSLIPKMARVTDHSPDRAYRSLAAHPSRTIVMVWNRYRFQTKLAARLLDTIRTELQTSAPADDTH